MAELPAWFERVDAWLVRQADHYECFIERRIPWGSRRGYATFLRQSADETEHFRPRGAARDRRKADRLEQEGLEIAFRMDLPDTKDERH